GRVAACRGDGFRRSRSRRLRTHLLGSSVASGAGWITRSGIASGRRCRAGQTSARPRTACKRDDRTVACCQDQKLLEVLKRTPLPRPHCADADNSPYHTGINRCPLYPPKSGHSAADARITDLSDRENPRREALKG